MPSVEITSYTAHTGRLGLLGSERILAVRHERQGPDGTPESATSEVYFADRFETGGGFGVINNGPSMRAHLPLHDYEIWLDLLRHEAPIFLHWSSEVVGEADTEAILHLSTGPEPPGEGPVDASPGHRS